MDIVLGSEVVYTDNIGYITCISELVSRLLKPTGCFYMIQSTDRAVRSFD